MGNESARYFSVRGDFSTWSALRTLLSRPPGGLASGEERFGRFRAASAFVRWPEFFSALGRRKKALREGAFWLRLLFVGYILLRSSTPPAPVVSTSGWQLHFLEIGAELSVRRGDFLRVTGSGEVLEKVLVVEAGEPGRALVALYADEVRWVEMARQKGMLRISLQSTPQPRKKSRKKTLSPPVQVWEGK